QRGYRVGSDQGQAKVDLCAEDLDHPPRSGLPADGEAVEVRPPDQARLRAECQRLHDIGSSAYAAVEEHLRPATDRFYDLGEDGHARRRAVELPAAVVGDDDPVDPAGDGFLRVL